MGQKGFSSYQESTSRLTSKIKIHSVLGFYHCKGLYIISLDSHKHPGKYDVAAIGMMQILRGKWDSQGLNDLLLVPLVISRIRMGLNGFSLLDC